MGHPFEQHKEAEVPASPDEVWAAIATGPGIDSWFMGRNDVQAGPGGTVRTVFGEYALELDVTGWDPGRRLAARSDYRKTRRAATGRGSPPMRSDRLTASSTSPTPTRSACARSTRSTGSYAASASR